MHYSFRFVLAVLAVWRLTHLLSREDGPFDIVVRIRQSLGLKVLRDLVSCFYCLSLWLAIPFAFFVPGTWLERTVAWLAISGAAILLERTTAEPFEIKVEGDHEWRVADKERQEV